MSQVALSARVVRAAPEVGAATEVRAAPEVGAATEVRAAPEAAAGVEVEKGGMGVDTRGPIRNPNHEFLLSSRPSLHSTPKNGSRRQLASG